MAEAAGSGHVPATVLEFEEFPGRTLTVLLFRDVPDAG
jgi:hypothetical protein